MGTLLDRALEYLGNGPADSPRITREVLGIPRAPGIVAERLAVALLGADPRVSRDVRGHWRLAHRRPSATAIDQCSFAVVDVETTGSGAGRGDRITEIAIVLVSERRSKTVFETLVNPGRPIPPVVTRLTRITDEMVRDQPTFDEIADDVLGCLAGRVFVAHNVAFDWRFVASEVRRARHLELDGPRVCTVKLARRYLGGLKNRGLDSVARYFGVEIEGRHRAGGDARATAAVLKHLLDRAAEQGAATLDDLILAQRGKTRRRRRRAAGPTWMDEV